MEDTERNHHHQFALELGLAKQLINKGTDTLGGRRVTGPWCPASDCHQVDPVVSAEEAGG